MKKEILNIIAKEHEVIESDFNDFLNIEDKSSQNAKKIFEMFKWKIEKHIFLEEKILYSIFSVWEGNINGMFEILSQHGEMILLIKKIEKILDNQLIYKLNELIKDNFLLEENSLYPALEEAMNSKQKKLFISKIKEIIRLS